MIKVDRLFIRCILHSCRSIVQVQNNIVVVTLSDGTKVGLSDFILPAWSKVENKVGPFNYMKTLKKPFTIDHGGYVVYMDSVNGVQNQAYAHGCDEWVREPKRKSFRTKSRKNLENIF